MLCNIYISGIGVACTSPFCWRLFGNLHVIAFEEAYAVLPQATPHTTAHTLTCFSALHPASQLQPFTVPGPLTSDMGAKSF